MNRSDDGVDERSGEGTPVEDRAEQSLRYLFPVDGECPHNDPNIACGLISDADAELVVASSIVRSDGASLGGPGPREEWPRLNKLV